MSAEDEDAMGDRVEQERAAALGVMQEALERALAEQAADARGIDREAVTMMTRPELTHLLDDILARLQAVLAVMQEARQTLGAGEPMAFNGADVSTKLATALLLFSLLIPKMPREREAKVRLTVTLDDKVEIGAWEITAGPGVAGKDSGR